MHNSAAARTTATVIDLAPYALRGGTWFDQLCPDWRGPGFLLDARSFELLHANMPARRLLAQGRPVSLLGPRLMLGSPPAARALAVAMAELVAGDRRTAMLVVDDPATNAAFGLRLYRLDTPHPGGDAIALLEVTDASVAPDAALLDAVAAAFYLTLAEGRVLGLLAAGHALREIAVKRGVRIETVRHQCKAVLSKMRCRRQSDLVRLVATLATSSSFA